MQFFSIQLRQYFPSTVGFFFSPPPTPCPPTLQIIKKQKSKTEQAEADFEWPPSRSSGLASVAVSDQSMLTFPGSRRGSYTLWVSDWAQLLTFAAAQNWKMENMEKCTYCLEWYVEACRQQALNLFLDKLWPSWAMGVEHRHSVVLVSVLGRTKFAVWAISLLDLDANRTQYLSVYSLERFLCSLSFYLDFCGMLYFLLYARFL